MSGSTKVTKKQLLKVIDDLQMNPNDRVRILGDLGIGVIGAGLGAAAAGTVAAIAGATSIPVLTTAASWVGISALAATPVGWTIGIAAVGGAGAGRSTAGAGHPDGHGAFDSDHDAHPAAGGDSRWYGRSDARQLIEKDAIAPKKAFQLIEAVECGAMPISQAYSLVSAILRS